MSAVEKSITLRYHIGDTYVSAGLTADFVQDFEDLLLDYIFAEWTISNPGRGATKQDTNSDLRFKPGFPDRLKPFEINALQTDTKIAERTDPASWHFFTTVEIRLSVERIAKDNIDPQLGNMEREVQRIINQYPSEDIPGIADLIFVRASRDYSGGGGGGRIGGGLAGTSALQSWAASRWTSVIYVDCSYHKTNIL